MLFREHGSTRMFGLKKNIEAGGWEAPTPNLFPRLSLSRRGWNSVLTARCAVRLFNRMRRGVGSHQADVHCVVICAASSLAPQRPLSARRIRRQCHLSGRHFTIEVPCNTNTAGTSPPKKVVVFPSLRFSASLLHCVSAVRLPVTAASPPPFITSDGSFVRNLLLR